MAGIGRPDVLWPHNTLARSVTTWNKACNKGLLRLSSIRPTATGNPVMSEFRLKFAILVFSTMPHVQVTCEIQNQRQEFYCACVDHTRLFPWICKKQSAVSHSRAESEIISLDAGLRIDGLPALLFWECVVDTLSSKQAKGDLERHKRERSFTIIHILKILSLSRLTMFHPTFQTVLTHANSTYLKTMRQ